MATGRQRKQRGLIISSRQGVTPLSEITSLMRLILLDGMVITRNAGVIYHEPMPIIYIWPTMKGWAGLIVVLIKKSDGSMQWQEELLAEVKIIKIN